MAHVINAWIILQFAKSTPNCLHFPQLRNTEHSLTPQARGGRCLVRRLPFQPAVCMVKAHVYRMLSPQRSAAMRCQGLCKSRGEGRQAAENPPSTDPESQVWLSHRTVENKYGSRSGMLIATGPHPAVGMLPVWEVLGETPWHRPSALCPLGRPCPGRSRASHHPSLWRPITELPRWFLSSGVDVTFGSSQGWWEELNAPAPTHARSVHL